MNNSCLQDTAPRFSQAAAFTRSATRILLATSAMAALLACAGCGLPVRPADADFGGTGASHGHP